MAHSANYDFEFFKLLLKYEQQNYNQLKEECLRKGVLFEDDLFEANSSSYYLPNEKRSNEPSPKVSNIEWLRPSQIVSDSNEPRFVHVNKSFSVCKKQKGSKSGQDFRTQFNFVRGRCGCSNFISSLTVLFWNKDAFTKVVPEDQSFDPGDYAGIFHFQIWQYGKWYDIVVDDRLPTLNGKLIQVHTQNNIEFWPSLLEKAFAKLNGCYQSLHGCAIGEYLEDLTGDLCESISSDMPALLNEGLFKILRHSMQLNAHVVVRISDEKSGSAKKTKNSTRVHTCSKQQLKNGLIKNQSYVVLEAKLLDHLGPDKGTTHLIKLCNPWKRLNQISFGIKNSSIEKASSSTLGHSGAWSDGKWAGSWSEHSQEWITLTDDVKAQFDLLLESDSHFWMPIESFVETFTDVDICHASSQQTSRADASAQSKVWHSLIFHGYWITGFSAGGCYNEETFHQNPAYVLPIHDEKSSAKQLDEAAKPVSESKDAAAPSKSHTVLIGLMQMYRNSKRTSGLHDLKIGFNLFKLEEDDLKYIQEVIYDDDLELTFKWSKSNLEKAKVRLKMKPEYFKTKRGEHPIKFFTNIREVSTRLILAEGTYLVIPSTYGPNCDGNFLLRMICEAPFKLREKDLVFLKNAQSGQSTIKDLRISKNYFAELMFTRPLHKIAILNEHVDVEHLEVLLKSVTTLSRNCFSLDQCQTLLALYDLDYKGNLSDVQIQHLCIDIDECYRLFLHNDKTMSRSISSSELKAALAEMGINISQRIIEMLVNRYGNTKKIVVNGVPIRELNFPNFAICVLKLRKALIYWDMKFRNSSLAPYSNAKPDSSSADKQSTQDCKCSHFTLADFIRQVIYS